MISDYDQSHKDKKYFIDGNTFNCPFCKRRHIAYRVTDKGSYNNSNTKLVYFYLVRCEDCRKTSFHLSKKNLQLGNQDLYGNKTFTGPLKELVSRYSQSRQKCIETEEDLVDENNKPQELDNLFFYSQPTSYFTIDERIPKEIREPLSESEISLNYNLLTGASGALRKAIFKLLKIEKIPEFNSERKLIPYDQRLNQLKEKYTSIDPDLFSELEAVHVLTSQELHENDWEDFNAPTLRLLIHVTNQILIELYVKPDEKEKRRAEIQALKTRAKPKKNDEIVTLTSN